MILTSNSNKMHFSGTNVDTVRFTRPAHNLILTSSGTVGLSFDGTNFMTVTAGTHQFLYVNAKEIFFNGSGTWSGVGIAV